MNWRRLWDMDGVLVESAPFHFEAWKRAWAELDLSVSEADFRKNFGQRNDTIIRDMLGDDVSPAMIDSIGAKKEVYYREAVKGHVEALPGAIQLLRALRGGRLSLCHCLGCAARQCRTDPERAGRRLPVRCARLLRGRNPRQAGSTGLPHRCAARSASRRHAALSLRMPWPASRAPRRPQWPASPLPPITPGTRWPRADLIVDSLTEVSPRRSER